MEARALQRYLHDHIPLSAAMGTRVLEAGVDGVVLEAPLGPNVNHRSTAFGGSVAALAVLSGWALVHLGLRAEGIHSRTLVQRSDMTYLEPVADGFQAVAAPVSPQAWHRFLRTLRRWGRARVTVSVDVRSGGVTVATLDGDYVALFDTED